MILPDYLSDVEKQMSIESESIRRDFSTHHLSAGENQEVLVEKFLKSHLPERFGVSRGLVISHDGVFSNQADLVVVDKYNNSPLYAAARNKLWPVESVYALIEVKTTLNPSTLSDAISKGRKYKKLKRSFCNADQMQRLADSLYAIWAFESASPSTVKTNLLSAYDGIPFSERPDLIIVLNSFVVMSGSYLSLVKFGLKGSAFQNQLKEKLQQERKPLYVPELEMAELKENSLLGYYLWFDSWLRRAGSRFTDPLTYLPVDGTFGRVV